MRGLLPFFQPYLWPLAAAVVFLLLAAGATLAFPIALRALMDQGMARETSAEMVQTHFLWLFALAAALA